jgi:catechol 2,3-dioxygenase-like lactoylglutathione lyase family enzyme
MVMFKRNQVNNPLTQGSHHIGLTVSKLDESAAFFSSLLGWKEVGRSETYPAIFVSDGKTMVTLWAAQTELPVDFNRKANVGLHHVAFHVETENALNRIYEKMVDHSVKIEFAPELLNKGPAKHMMCYEPSGIRVEFIWPGKGQGE